MEFNGKVKAEGKVVEETAGAEVEAVKETLITEEQERACKDAELLEKVKEFLVSL